MLEPILSTKEQDYAHKVFNNLFLSYEFLEDSGTILVKEIIGIKAKRIFI